MHPVQVPVPVKKVILENAWTLFDAKLGAKPIDESSPEDKRMARLYGLSRPFYGRWWMMVFQRTAGHIVNRKRVQSLMLSGLAGMAPGPNTSKVPLAQSLDVAIAERVSDAF